MKEEANLYLIVSNYYELHKIDIIRTESYIVSSD